VKTRRQDFPGSEGFELQSQSDRFSIEGSKDSKHEHGENKVRCQGKGLISKYSKGLWTQGTSMLGALIDR
jgi:hypothetical protein